MFFYIARFVLSVIFHITHRVSVKGHENIPTSGGFVLCSNHASALDPIFITISVKRPLHFMGKEELFRNKLLSIFFHHLNAFPVNRKSVDMSTFKTAIKLLKSGHGMLLFAQGSRMKELDVKSAKSGVSLFGIKAGVPIVPTLIDTNYKFFSKVSISFGEPIIIDEHKYKRLDTAALNEITENIMEKIKLLQVN